MLHQGAVTSGDHAPSRSCYMSSTTHLDRTNMQLLSDTMLLRLQQAEPAFVVSLRNLACDQGKRVDCSSCGHVACIVWRSSTRAITGHQAGVDMTCTSNKRCRLRTPQNLDLSLCPLSGNATPEGYTSWRVCRSAPFTQKMQGRRPVTTMKFNPSSHLWNRQ